MKHLLRTSKLGEDTRVDLYTKNDTNYYIKIESKRYKMRIDIRYNRFGLGLKNVLRVEKITALKVSNVLSLYFQIVAIIRMGEYKRFIGTYRSLVNSIDRGYGRISITPIYEKGRWFRVKGISQTWDVFEILASKTYF